MFHRILQSIAVAALIVAASVLPIAAQASAVWGS
jgi:hypothetical protein